MSEQKESTTFVDSVTPEQARAYLLKNRHNRPLMQHHVDRLATLILKGQWIVTHQGIAFDTEGFLLDGQHRLAAIVQANRAVQLRITLDLPPDAMMAIDTGAKRTQGQLLHLRGQKYAGAWAAALNGVRGLLTRTERGPFSVQDLETILREEAELVERFEPVFRSSHTRVRWVAGPFFFAMKKNPDKVLAFIDQYITGTGLEDRSPVLALRQLLIEGRSSRVFSPRERGLRVLGAVRHYLAGTHVTASHLYAVESNVDFFARGYLGHGETLLGALAMQRLKEEDTTSAEPPTETAKAPRPKRSRHT